MGSLLIIDDELDILESLQEMFLYEVSVDIDVYTANSAKKAIQLLDKMRFDVVLTDIRMPGMNGVELFKVIKENWPQCKVIFLTGYKEFDYLYEINDYKDVRYLLKSEDDSVIIKTVLDAFDDIQKMIEQEYSALAVNLEMDKAQMWLRKEFLNQLIYNKSIREVQQKQFDDLKIPLKSDTSMLVFLFHLDNFGIEDFIVEEFYLYQNVIHIVHHFMSDQIQVHVHLVTNGYGILMLQPQITTDSLTDLQWERMFNLSFGALEYIQENFSKTVNKSISFVASSIPCSLQDLHLHYERLKKLAISRLGVSEQMIVKEEVREQEASENPHGPVNLRPQIQLLETYLEMRKPLPFFDTLDILLCSPEKVHNKYYDATLALYYNIAITLLNFINENNLTAAIAEKISLDKLTTADRHASPENSLTYLYDISNNIFEILGSEARNRTNEALQKVQAYIENNLNEDLTLNRLAEIGCFNASYLSRIFKQTYGCNLSDYIGKGRVELAKRLLRTSNERINEISRKVGYISAHSFTRVFKHITGMTPIEYRDKYGEFR
ncbi:response regulator [Paenibacillus sp. FSL R10-2734]|uniref:response regulator n=1 Tax=Paenibacillus sp. FSL R10-2734 TaxID=2954691 RepID=UPI0030DC59D0